MKPHLKLLLFFSIGIVVVFAVYLAREISAPLSAIIAKERNALARSLDKEQDAARVQELQVRLRFLDERLALAYIAENKPDAAIRTLQKLIDQEEAKDKSGIRRNARSYFREARFYEEMSECYELKKDDIEAIATNNKRIMLLSTASELKKRENREEGSSVGGNVD